MICSVHGLQKHGKTATITTTTTFIEFVTTTTTIFIDISLMLEDLLTLIDRVNVGIVTSFGSRVLRMSYGN